MMSNWYFYQPGRRKDSPKPDLPSSIESQGGFETLKPVPFQTIDIYLGAWEGCKTNCGERGGFDGIQEAARAYTERENSCKWQEERKMFEES